CNACGAVVDEGAVREIAPWNAGLLFASPIPEELLQITAIRTLHKCIDRIFANGGQLRFHIGDPARNAFGRPKALELFFDKFPESVMHRHFEVLMPRAVVAEI